ncbi:MAG: hypothetical protein VYB65_05050 [Myxococcota bacterium]|nr:hypothetical protein [Myxococcota bacterium]
MYNFLIATGAATLIGILAGVGLGGWTYGIIPALLVLLGGYFILLRRSIKKVEVISARVGQIMTAAERQSRGQARNPRAAKQSISRAIDQSIAELRKGYDIGQWQWGVRSQLDAQIGNLLFMSERYTEAKPYLKTGFVRQWTTRAMLGVLLYKEGNFSAMRDAFDECIRFNKKKQGLLYACYAWCLLNAKDGRKSEDRRADALEVLNRGHDAMDKKDDNLARNLDAVRNGKRMNMTGYGQQWYMFRLEAMKTPRQQVRGR